MHTCLQPSVIVIIDDDLSVRSSLASLVRSYGWAVETYGSAAGALSEIAQLNISLMIVDFQMPGMDGITLMNEIAAKRISPPFLFVTAHATKEVLARMQTAGSAGCFSKPIDNAALVSKIAEIVGRRG